MNPEHQRIESLLEQIPLSQPSGSLDKRISEICDGDVHCSSQLNQRVLAKRSWVSLFTVALVASLAGFLLGQIVKWKPSDAQGSGVVNLGGAVPIATATLTPVKFNISAFRLLHRHSELPAYAKCKDCHSQDGPTKAFDGWYYGDQNFFAAHQSGNMSNCSSCHTVETIESVDNTMEDFKHFKGRNCSACHGAQNDSKTGV